MELGEDTLHELVGEVREDFQIPPYFPDKSLENYTKEGYKTLLDLKPGADIVHDDTFRMLLKNYVNYAYHHKVNEWRENYKGDILQWMLGGEVDYE